MKNLWKKLRKIKTWKQLAPWIAVVIAFWFFPPLVAFFLWVVIVLVDMKVHWSSTPD